MHGTIGGMSHLGAGEVDNRLEGVLNCRVSPRDLLVLCADELDTSSTVYDVAVSNREEAGSAAAAREPA